MKRKYVDVHVLNNILKQRNDASQALYQSVQNHEEPTEIQLRMNFLWLKKFIDIASDLPETIPVGPNQYTIQAVFIIEQVSSSLLHLPNRYKDLITDQNCCSLFYDIIDLYDFFRLNNLPQSLNRELSQEIIKLTKEFLALVIEIPVNGGLNLRTINPNDNFPIKFDRATLHFQYFSYYKDIEYLEKTIKLLNLSIDEIYAELAVDNYQLLSVIANLGENLSRRTISPRITEFLSSDINIDFLTGIRNYILHREQDLSMTLQRFLGVDNRKIIIELKELRESLLNVDLFLRVNIDSNNLNSIRDFYNSKYPKISIHQKMMTEDVEKLQELCPQFSSLLKSSSTPKDLSDSFFLILKMASNNRDAFVEQIRQYKEVIAKYFRDNGKRLKDEGFRSNDIKKELDKLIMDSKIDVSQLALLEMPDESISLESREGQNAILSQLRIYTEELENIILRLHPSNPTLHSKTILDSEVDFDSYRLLQFPGYIRRDLSNILSDRCIEISQLSLQILSQRYKEYSYESYGIRVLDTIGDEVPERMIGIFNKLSSLDGTRNTLYYKIGESIYQVKRGEDLPSEMYDSFIKLCFERLHQERGELTSEMWKTLFDVIIRAGHIQTILVPLTHTEHQQVLGYAADRSTLKTERLLDEACMARLNALTVNLEERLEQYLAFLEISTSFESNKQMLQEAELLVIFIEQLHRSISEKALPTNIVKDMKIFRNYLSHNGKLLDLAKHQTHEQTTLKYVLEIRKHLDNKIIPSLNDHINDWYTEDQIDLLLMIYLRDQSLYYVAPQTQFEHVDLLRDNLNVAIEAAMNENRVSVLPINLHHNHWVGVVIRRQEDNNIEVIYVDPMGGRIEDEENVLLFMQEISSIIPTAHIIDLGRAGFRQQSNHDDCGPFTVSNLVNLATAGRQLDNLTAEQIIDLHLLVQSESGSAMHLREEYTNIYNWYTIGTTLPTSQNTAIIIPTLAPNSDIALYSNESLGNSSNDASVIQLSSESLGEVAISGAFLGTTSDM